MRNIIAFIFFVFIGCAPDEAAPILESGEEMPGGTLATTSDWGENAFGIQAQGMTAEQDGFFVTGNSFFRSNWITAPASVKSLDGLGPIFNAISCGSCHFKDGRAQPPASPESPLNGLLFRLSTPGAGPHGGPLGDPVYGLQLQDKAVLNVDAEAKVRVQYEEISGKFADGSTYWLRRPIYEFYDPKYGDFTPGFLYSPRIAPQVPGLGLLEIVPEGEIIAFSDENDLNGDGISGKPNYVWDESNQRESLGRFGWKANQPSLLQQTASAFNGDIGITSSLFPEDHLTPVQRLQHGSLANGGEPEIENSTLQKVVTYLQALSVPSRRKADDSQILKGKALFQELNCQSCHRPSMNTGGGGEITALQNQKIFPYTDLLLHDMGEELADNRPDFRASGQEWRTPPLWGIGLIPTVNGHLNLLHDGRARGVGEAILWHGGEATKSKDAYKKLNAADREALVKFVESL